MTAATHPGINTPLYSAAAIAALRQPQAAQVSVTVVDETGSTNADLLAQLPQLQGPALLLAAQQTAGRGRAGRTWHSAAGASLTFSLAWKFSGPLPRLLGLPLAVGVAVAEALGRLGVQVRLKWPNDIFKDGKKLGGILIETSAAQPSNLGPNSGSADGAGVWAVIGIGLNLLMPEELEAAIGRSTGDAPWLAQIDRNILVAALLNALGTSLRQFDADGFAPCAPRWNRLHVHQGKTVRILDHDRLLQQGTALGVDELGRLLLDTAAGQVAIMAGDVSLREPEADT